ncbi:helix-turn-helix domain-containing protein [Algoriphagus sediminis]|uniref:Helix-turn-helix domain-containing protein n=1 Tax=Algoriphagus sediminis TaxID=3057113 RepID=A0ABT7YCF4_9BACT|nr:helix-turn-helix domain-containing protein [Algoriphagus sediminis]MDN3204181.1 helix-turn-helix domain-containing protein [Algoriphagus sediminis]
MVEDQKHRSDFLSQATAIVVERASDEQFGVSELAEAMNMSRSNLLRKVQAATNLSASVFIRQIRLEIAMDLLKEGNMTVSEVSYQVGFGSASYFIKCFREQYGFPPGEVGKQELVLSKTNENQPKKGINRRPSKYWSLGVLIIILIGVAGYFLWSDSSQPVLEEEKSIAVLPFKNESADSSNLYFVNGLMESTLNNLQKIKNLRVISRSSVEKYRNTDKSILEMAEELGVNYFVSGSGQKIGEQVLLNIQLIEANDQEQIWAGQYNRELADIFAIQNEIATQIADAIKVIITPVELQQIEKRPTENLLAYDYYLQALDPYHTRTDAGLQKGILLFEKAIEQDPEFSLAYAHVAISYYLLEMFRSEKQFTEKINSYADKALLLDSKSAESLTAKAFYYIQSKEFSLARPYLEKALEYNPNSALAIQMLADFYFRMVPNTEKYLEYALKGTQLQVTNGDSTSQSYSYLQLSNALISAGFVDEALEYIDRSLAFDPANYYAPHLRAFILFAKDGNIERTKQLLISEWEKNQARLDILQDIGKLYYVEEQYDSAFFYYQKFVKARKESGQSIYPMEDGKIAIVYEKMGMEEEAKLLFQQFSDYVEADQSMYRNINLAMINVYKGNNDLAIKQIEAFAEEDNYQFWFLLLEDEPVFNPLKSSPEYQRAMTKIKDNFWERHEQIKRTLEKSELI